MINQEKRKRKCPRQYHVVCITKIELMNIVQKKHIQVRVRIARATKNTRVIHDGFRDLEPKLSSRVSCNVKMGLKSVKLCSTRWL